MLPSSDDLEALHARVRQVTAALTKVGGTEVPDAATKENLAGIARVWLRLSPSLRQSHVCDGAVLDSCDEDMQALLSGTTSRARATTLRRRLERFSTRAVEQVIVPLIQFEGSPRQVGARQVQAAFPHDLEPEEIVCVEEAARCMTALAFRAAIILLWAAGVARMHRAVGDRGCSAFNAAIDACLAKTGAPFDRLQEGAKIASLSELPRSRDADVLVVGVELFGYDLLTFEEMDRLLVIRNDATRPDRLHPNALDVQQYAQKVGVHIFQTVRLPQVA
jgi:hypothetical protein